ncbi:MAG: 6-phosphogluconate dehydrogenase (decarboxylating) [Deltaproteobacteria bacterium 13_1_20CM_2_69_21]|nr:MAG: 6-phosphogluconate dehydrogenase (decarboxylating) [Deltaproteobacteria bacterium 13_1_20CM_2_69_21]
MRLAMLGLGRMGGNMVQRLLQGGHKVVAYDVDPRRAIELAAVGAAPATTIDEVIAALAPPRVCWTMVPAGKITEEVVTSLAARMQKGDIIIDGGNSNFRDSQRRAKELAERGIHFCDAGTSGGVWGLKNGYCLMVGGAREAYAAIEPALKSLAPEGGLMHTGPAGSGHFVKMVHNGIEYGLMTAYAEGFEILKTSPFGQLDLAEIASIWRHGSVVRSWLLDLLHDALERDPGLDGIRGYVEDSGEGRWTVQAAIEQNVPAPVITLALQMRIASRQEESFSAKVQAALRNEFGGHAVKKG